MELIENRVKGYANYKIMKKKVSIPSFPDFDDRYTKFALHDIALLRDMVWAIVKSVGSICVQICEPNVNIKELRLVDSETGSMKDTSTKDTIKCKLKYLPVILFPSGDNIVKYYQDMTKDLAEELGRDHM